jgi:hypothetical protein
VRAIQNPNLFWTFETRFQEGTVMLGQLAWVAVLSGF